MRTRAAPVLPVGEDTRPLWARGPGPSSALNRSSPLTYRPVSGIVLYSAPPAGFHPASSFLCTGVGGGL